ncbi:hypothetical protein R1sor_002461 [Riccia sorocarpa]|uniref:Uncharacterized protein n=1 Tax=Riccia sorocarpa TaxID=122646 RepID=A0ABD3H4Y6_9MARC
MADQWGGKRKREKSPVIETSEALAFQNISTLVQAMESEAWGQTILDMRVRLVIRQVLKILGKLSYHFCSTTLVLLAVAHVDPTCAHLRRDWHMFVSFEIRKSLNHDKTDKKSAGKFREGWGAIIELVRNEFMAKQAAASGEEPLYLEAKNAFSDTKAEWDNEKCELVRQREELKEELAKAQEQAALAAREKRSSVWKRTLCKKNTRGTRQTGSQRTTSWPRKSNQCIQ